MMIKKLALVVFTLSVFSCKDISKKEQEVKISENDTSESVIKKYPEALEKIFNAHGGLDSWQEYKTLSYEIPKEKNKEIHTIDLYSRMDVISIGGVEMGFDGSKVWLQNPENSYEGDPVFYHNLMFYFFAMPFVFGDDGINYGVAEALRFEGKLYPGISITYNRGVGTSPKDEYYLHYDPETYQMAWLGYTVTYRSGEDSDNIKWIRYNDWEKVEDVLLPRSISWFDYEGRTIKQKKNTVFFDNVNLSEESRPKEFYKKPEGGVFVEGNKQF